MKVLNLYAGIGGNRKLWDDCYVTAVENVESYYDPLITPTVVMDRHYFWSSYPITRRAIPKHDSDVSRATKEQLSDHLGIRLPDGTPDQRKLYRNAVHPDLGLHIYRQTPRQTSLFYTEET